MRIPFLMLGISTLVFFSCNTVEKDENSYGLAKEYCECLNQKLVNALDSSINPNVCNSVLLKSRFMSIHLEQNRNNYSQKTWDSATRFFNDVAAIIDTLYYNKTDSRKFKKLPHARM